MRETQLPGVGVKHDFHTEDGREVGVLTHKDGRRDVVVYDADDPDRCSMQITLSSNDTRTLGELLGTSQVNRAVQAVQQEIEGLAIEWFTLEEDSPVAGRTIADTEMRTRTGVSIVAIVRDDMPNPAPGPEFEMHPHDVVVGVGTIEGLARVRELVTG